MKRLILTLLLVTAAFVARPVTQTALPTVRVTAADFKYIGAFRLPGQNGTATTNNPDMRGEINTFHGGGEALAMSPDGQGIFLTGSRCCNDPSDAGPTTVAEIAIPEIRLSATIAGLATAAYRQPHRDLLNGQQRNVGCGGPLGGLLAWGGNLLANVYCYYDGGYVQNRSLFIRTGTLTNAGTLRGPLEVQSPESGGGRAGFVSQYFGVVPPEWRAALGGDLLAGNCCIPIITRTSWGPAVSVFKSEDLGRDLIPATSLVGYPSGHPLDGDASCNQQSPLFHCNTSVSAVVMVPGTDSTLFFGTHGTGEPCYGPGTTDRALHMQPDGEGGHYCYDPTGGSKGAHAYPYFHQVWGYATSDLVKVKNGQLKNYEVRPYGVWSYETPFQVGRRGVSGATFDPATRRLFVSLGEQDVTNGTGKPLIHVFQIGTGTNTPPPPPPPSDTTAPTVAITSPTQGQIVSGQAVFGATGSDNVGILSVEALLDGNVAQTTQNPTFPLSTPFDSRLIPDGNHTLQLRARDAAGNVGTSQAVSFSVLNAVAPPPPPPPPPPGPVFPSFTVEMVTDRCRLRVPAQTAPSPLPGWKVQIRRGSVNHNAADSTSPYGPFSALVSRGTYPVTATWTKTGETPVVVNLGTFVCE